MPFQSEKQRRYLHANHPEIAKRWERDYANGGILDINESEEIISDDGNDIELTDYNAAFDDPNDLSTGVKTLFQAKDGGRIGFKRGTSGAPGGGDPGMSSGGGKSGDGGNKGWSPGVSHSGAPDSHGQKAHGKGGRFDVANTKTTTTSPKGDDDAREKYISTRKYPKRYKTVKQPNPHLEKGFHTTQIRDYYDPKGYQKRAPKTKEESSLLDKIAWGIAIYTGIAPVLGLKVPGIVATTGKLLGYRENIDMALNKAYELGLINKNVTTDSLADSFVENFKNKTAKKAEYDSLPSGHPDKIALGIELQIGKTTEDGGPDGSPSILNPVTLEVGEEYAQGDYDFDSMSNWNAMKQKQALNAQLQEQWENEMASWSANSGGLANLFRVKNQ